MKNSHVIEEYIDVGVPASFAFEHWTRYSDWSQFFKKEDAKAGDDGKVQVNAKIGPSHRQWTTEVVKEERDRRVDWRAKGGVKAKGSVIFNPLDDRLTHLTVDIEYQPSGAFETVGNFLRMPRRRVRKDLKLFKNYIELHADKDEEQDDEQEQPEDEQGQARGESEGGEEAQAEDDAEAEDESEAGEEDDEGSDDGSETDDEDQEGR